MTWLVQVMAGAETGVVELAELETQTRPYPNQGDPSDGLWAGCLNRVVSEKDRCFQDGRSEVSFQNPERVRIHILTFGQTLAAVRGTVCDPALQAGDLKVGSARYKHETRLAAATSLGVQPLGAAAGLASGRRQPMLISSLSGLFAGLVHVLSGPDHLAAVAPFATHPRQPAWRMGFRWGVGHAGGVLFIGLLSCFLRELLPLDWFSSWAERLVGVVLIGIGIWGLRKAFTNRLHTHQHSHGVGTHVHIHVHGPQDAHAHPTSRGHDHRHTTLAIGALHGVAGSSHLWAVLPALAFPSRTQALLYVTAYGVGTIAAMTSFSSLMGLVARHFAHAARGYRLLLGSCSAAAVLIGCFWCVRTAL